MTEIKLNIGAGSTVIEGFTPIDRKLGTEAFPLPYADGSVDEIRASHILEHFTFGDAQKAMEEWSRVLKPGGRIRISVPDVDKVLKDETPNRLFYLMGGQMHADDIHKSAYDRNRLTALMHQNGLKQIKDWYSPNTDSAALPISLNLEGVKAPVEAPVKKQNSTTIRLGAYLTLPRYESVVCRSLIELALRQLKIELTTSQGVFWGQCMQRMFTKAVDDGIDWILSIDSDSLFTSEQLSLLMDTLASNPHIDALAALQCRRGCPYPLLTTGELVDGLTVEVSNAPFKVTTAHFGLTLFRVDALREVPKPWFCPKPDGNGEWGDERMDDDIFFWHQWRLAGKNIYVAPQVSIGHMEETVVQFNDEMKPEHMYVQQWRESNLK
jgi:predicted SAM-dependent methyltransferase